MAEDERKAIGNLGEEILLPWKTEVRNTGGWLITDTVVHFEKKLIGTDNFKNYVFQTTVINVKVFEHLS